MSDTIFEPSLDSMLANYRCPEWFRDAKFGIYIHWGVYSVAERGEWYARQMYLEGDPSSDHHRKTYGHPSEFGYKDLIPMWKAERFDPDRLIDLFKQAGAKYFTPCAVHHDNFDLWDSKHHKWNAVNMGPKKDLIGMFRKATLEQGLRFGVTTHLARSYSWFKVNKGADREGPLKGVPYDGADPAYADFYFESHDDTDCGQPLNPPEHWRRQWAARMKDLIDNYEPDHLYFDGAVPFRGPDRAQTGLEVMAHFYNQNARRHGGQNEGVMCIKNVRDHGWYFDAIATLDVEVGRLDWTSDEPWQTDTSTGTWGYVADAQHRYRPVGVIVKELVDIVSKNGNMLLNVPPRADGTLDQATEDILAGVGRWMDINGEGIYGTRPWILPGQQMKSPADPDTPIEIRFTKKGDAVYAFALDWPGDEMVVAALGSPSPPRLNLYSRGSIYGVELPPIAEVTMLGAEGKLTWTQDNTGLRVQLPPEKPCDHVFALKVQFKSDK